MEASGQLNALAALLPGKELIYLLNRRPAWPQSRFGGGEYRKILPEIEPWPFSP
jgi:hypothetical protein